MINKIKGLLLPVTVFEGRGRFSGDHEDRPHGMDVTVGRLPLGHLQGGDAQAPDVLISSLYIRLHVCL